MRVEKLNHVVIYVKELEAAMQRLSEVLGTRFIGPFDKRKSRSGCSLPFRVAFDMLGLEMLCPTTPNTGEWIPQQWYDDQGEGLIHLSFKVDNLEEAIKECEAKGVRMINRGSGIGDCKAALFSPETMHGVMFEFLQYDAVPYQAIVNQDKNVLVDTPWFHVSMPEKGRSS